MSNLIVNLSGVVRPTVPAPQKPAAPKATGEDFEQSLSRADAKADARQEEKTEEASTLPVNDDAQDESDKQAADDAAADADVQMENIRAEAAPVAEPAMQPAKVAPVAPEIMSQQAADSAAVAQAATGGQGKPRTTESTAKPVAAVNALPAAAEVSSSSQEAVKKLPVDAEPAQVSSVEQGLPKAGTDSRPGQHVLQTSLSSGGQDEPIDPNVARVARGLQTALSQQGGSVTLRLQPAELGQVRIDVSIQNGVVRAEFQTQNESVRSLLQHQLGHLRHALESQGLVVDRLDVQAQPQSQDAGAERHGLAEEGGQGRSRGRRDDRGAEQGERSGRDTPETFAQALVNVVG